jgi:hypothetical protein
MRVHLERRHHLALLLAVEQIVMILHGYERRELVIDRIVYV